MNIKDKNEEQIIVKRNSQEIIVPYGLYTSKVLENTDLFMTLTNFKNRNMKKID